MPSGCGGGADAACRRVECGSVLWPRLVAMLRSTFVQSVGSKCTSKIIRSWFRTAISPDSTPKQAATLPLTCKLHMWKDNSSNGRISHLLLIWQENRTSDVTCKTDVKLSCTPSTLMIHLGHTYAEITNAMMLSQTVLRKHSHPPGNTCFKKSFHAGANKHSKKLEGRKKQSASSNHLGKKVSLIMTYKKNLLSSGSYLAADHHIPVFSLRWTPPKQPHIPVFQGCSLQTQLKWCSFFRVSFLRWNVNIECQLQEDALSAKRVRQTPLSSNNLSLAKLCWGCIQDHVFRPLSTASWVENPSTIFHLSMPKEKYTWQIWAHSNMA